LGRWIFPHDSTPWSRQTAEAYAVIDRDGTLPLDWRM